MLDRAAQFSPFAALTGYEDAIQETGRLTDTKVEIGEEVREELDRKQQYLQDIIADRPEITITYFVPDERKAGGSYTSHTGSLKRIDYYERVFVLTDGTKIPLDEIADIESECFRGILRLAAFPADQTEEESSYMAGNFCSLAPVSMRWRLQGIRASGRIVL